MSILKLTKNKALSPGQSIKRTELKKYLKLSGQGGIDSSVKNSLTCLFSYSKEGAKHGYNDGWNKGIFEYFGQGLLGNMEMKGNNKSLLNHKLKQRRVFLFFKGLKGEVIYENEFTVDEGDPYFWTTSIDDEGKLRDSIVFRLKPIKKYSIKNPIPSQIGIVTKTIAREIPLEKSSGNKSSKGVTYISRGIKDKKEARLVEEYNKYRRGKKLKDLKRHSLQPPLSKKNYFTDGFEAESKTLIEAKASSHRDKIRMAIGQLFDYKKLLEEDNVKVNNLAILAPTCPSKDLLELLKDLKIKIIFKEGNKFIKK